MAPGPGGHGPVHFMTDEEKQQVPKVTKGLLLRIASYLKPYKFQFALVFITILLSAAIGLLPSIITGRIVDQALVGKNLDLLVKLLIAAFATMALSQIISVLESYINAWISARIIFDMKNQMYAHLQSMPHSFFTTEKQGDIITRMNSDIDEMNQMVDETLSVSGSLLVKLFTKEEVEYERFVKVNEEVTRYNIKEQRSGQWFRVMMGMFTQVGPLLIYFAGGYLIIAKGDPNLTVGTITATVALINRLYRPVQSLLNIQVDFTRSLALFTRIFDYFDKTNNIKDPLLGTAPDLSNPSVEFQHVAFSYTPDKQILTDINFFVPGGQMYAIVGRSGSGKSTVVNLIPRLYDVDSGHVKVAGQDVRSIKLKMLRQAIGMVSQESYLFNGTIKENLLYAKPDATQEEIEAACKIANIHDMIAGLEKGYDTEVGNRGLKLSGGEKQRISLARVVLKDPKILILDEATSALDSISENAIQDALDKVMEGRTSIVIAHRLSTILSADKILVVDGGVVAESGSHEELLALGGIYKELYETQFSKVLDK